MTYESIGAGTVPRVKAIAEVDAATIDYRGIQYRAIAGGSRSELDGLTAALAATAGELDGLVRRFQLAS